MGAIDERVAGWVRHLGALIAVLLLGGCVAAPVSSETRHRIERQVYPGMGMAEAQANLQGLDFDCRPRSGAYLDADGQERPAKAFLSCVERPGVISFYCAERTHVVIVPDGDRVSKVVISNAPSCYRK